MPSRRTILIWIGVLAVGLAAIAASQSRRAQNLYYALNYERVYDRYEQMDTTVTDVTETVDENGREAALLSAFFGVDQGLPGIVADRAICDGAGGMDGMPVIFSHEVDITTLEPGDFLVRQQSGALGEVTCLTLAPADDAGELRTALLAGQFGDPSDPPTSVEIVGDVLSLNGNLTFKGTQVAVTPLEAGPSLVWAEIVPESEWTLGRLATGIPFGGGSGCPAQTKQIVRVTWGGGVTKPSGQAADAAEGALYEVIFTSRDEGEGVVTPMALADTGDGDNNHKLCLDDVYPVTSVRFPAGRLTDPRDDLNPATEIALLP